MFYGSYSHTLDEKGRLVIPRKMREEIGHVAYVLKGFDGALSIYKQEAFDKLVSEINSLPFNEKNTRAYLRLQLASVSELEVDKMGRVQIPTQMLNKFGIGKDVTVLGAGDHIEVWDAKAYSNYESTFNACFEDIAESLSKEK